MTETEQLIQEVLDMGWEASGIKAKKLARIAEKAMDLIAGIETQQSGFPEAFETNVRKMVSETKAELDVIAKEEA